ncbi:MAG: 1,4-dihydroxy-2-naphthoate octaprenyltransferase [Polaribacter sp.]|nr:1,4-dihydroxy-2-naphthoate octaprenyltransferase [Polaribacter sp.]
MDVKKYLQAARLRTLPLSLSGIVVGSFLAASQHVFDWKICALALLTTVGFQVVSNFANDYGDGVKGTDDHRVGEKRLVASGAISPKQMKTATWVATILTLVVALLLIYSAFGKDNIGYSILFFLLGIASVAAAIKYTVGKFAYGYSGFGDVFVFLFFGLLSVVGSYFLFAKHINVAIFLPAISVGLLSVAVLNLNNMRDSATDKKAGKHTLVVKIGMEFAKYYHYCLIIASFLCAFLYVVVCFQKTVQFLFVLAYIPLVKHLIFVVNNKVALQLDGELKKVALSTFLVALLFGLGQIL